MVVYYSSNLLAFTFPDLRKGKFVFICTLPSFTAPFKCLEVAYGESYSSAKSLAVVVENGVVNMATEIISKELDIVHENHLS